MVEHDAPDRGPDDRPIEFLERRVEHVLIVPSRGEVHVRSAQPETDGGQRLDVARLEREQHFVFAAKHAELGVLRQRVAVVGRAGLARIGP